MVEIQLQIHRGTNAHRELNQNKALHTAQYYLDGYTGDITVQGTMDRG